MEKKFKPGDKIDCKGSPIKVVNWLAEGGQGDVYVIEQLGQQKALKCINQMEWGRIPKLFMKI